MTRGVVDTAIGDLWDQGSAKRYDGENGRLVLALHPNRNPRVWVCRLGAHWLVCDDTGALVLEVQATDTPSMIARGLGRALAGRLPVYPRCGWRHGKPKSDDPVLDHPRYSVIDGVFQAAMCDARRGR